MKKFLLIFLFLSVFLFCPFFSSAANFSDVVINEIAWMGSASSTNDEWVELKNNSSNQIDLSDWSIRSAEGKIKINLKGTISANGFYLMERTDDTSVPNITTDLIYAGALSNGGMDLKLYDSLNNIIDEVNCAEKWFTGDNTTKQTMEKTHTGWQTSQNPGGTPKAQNGTGGVIAIAVETANTEPIEAINEQVKNDATTIYPIGVVLNEILPNPEGPDEQEEFVELYNSNNFDVDLSGWEIKDITGSITNHFFPLNTIIQAGKFLTIYRLKTKVTLNNDGDGLILSSPDKKIVDSVVFTSAPLGQSYSKNNSSWLWSTTLTPDAKNIITSLESLSNAKNSVKNSDVNASLAAISQNISQDALKNNLKAENPWFLFFTTLIITIILATIVLFIKLRFMSVTKP